MRNRVGFTCPDCGSRHFESDETMALCHDEFSKGCHWLGPNWKGFLIWPEGEHGFRRATSEGEFQRVHDAWIAEINSRGPQVATRV